ncbi:MAG: hypothetical protein HGA45_10955 [Chloroflexales bacterium]|nr:hypothetical protein [Chloroflexales bacterium]
MPSRSGPVRPLTFVVALLALLATLLGGTAAGARAPAPPAAAPDGELAQNTNTGRLLFLPVVHRGIPETTIPPSTISADLSIRPVPLEKVQRGRNLSVEYRFRNDGASNLTARFNLFYPERLINFEWLDASSDAYIFHNGQRVEVEVRNVAPGATRTGRINFLVLSAASVGSRIGLYAEYTCRTGSLCQSNYAEVEVIANEDESSGGTFTMSASPDRGPPGTAHTFRGSRFRPGETYVTWLNTPTGVQALDITGRADNGGNIRFTFGSGGLSAGYYSMVARGQSSRVENVGPFIVQVNGQPQAASLATASLSGGADLGVTAAPRPAAAPAQATGSGGIVGHVRDASGAGLVGVTVEARDVEGDLVGVARSRANGVYIVPTGLATGQYTVTARPAINPDFALFASATVAPVAVTSPEMTSDVDLTLPAGGGLAGKVTAGDAGVGGVRVSAIAGGVTLGADVTSATGTYSITNLPVGSYTLAFDPRASLRAGLYSSGELGGQSVAAGQISAVADFALAPSDSTGIIAGTVSDATTSAGISDVIVVITPAVAAQGETRVSVSHTEADGSYTSDPLPEGSYRVQFVTLFSEVVTTTRYSGEFYNDAATFAESDPVSVSLGQTTTADASLALGGSISGTVTGRDVGALEDVFVLALDSSGVPRGLTLTDADGAYTLRGLRVGSYTVKFIASHSVNTEAQAFYDTSYDTTPATPDPTPVAVDVGAAVTGIDITLELGVQIVGTVSAGDTGEPLNGVIVVFIAEPLGGQATLAGATLTDTAGSYSSPALGPGRYKIFYTTVSSPDATSRTYQDEYLNDAATLETATPVLVGTSTITRNAELAPGGTVSGRVSAASTEEGLGGVFVVARSGATVVGGTITDEEGRYSLEGLPAGQVTLTFETAFAPEVSVRAYPGTTATVTVTIGGTTTQDVVLTVP